MTCVCARIKLRFLTPKLLIASPVQDYITYLSLRCINKYNAIFDLVPSSVRISFLNLNLASVMVVMECKSNQRLPVLVQYILSMISFLLLLLSRLFSTQETYEWCALGMAFTHQAQQIVDKVMSWNSAIRRLVITFNNHRWSEICRLSFLQCWKIFTRTLPHKGTSEINIPAHKNDGLMQTFFITCGITHTTYHMHSMHIWRVARNCCEREKN